MLRLNAIRGASRLTLLSNDSFNPAISIEGCGKKRSSAFPSRLDTDPKSCEIVVLRSEKTVSPFIGIDIDPTKVRSAPSTTRPASQRILGRYFSIAIMHKSRISLHLKECYTWSYRPQEDSLGCLKPRIPPQ